MKRADFEKLTDDLIRAHEQFVSLMMVFTRTTARMSDRVMTSDDQAKARELLATQEELERRWFEFVRSSEPIED
jgi:hypothetical protein